MKFFLVFGLIINQLIAGNWVFVGGSAFSNTKTLQLDGATQYVDFGNNYNLATGSSSFSFAGWVYATASSNLQGLVDKQNPSSPFQGYGLYYNTTGATGALRFQLGSTTPTLLDCRTAASSFGLSTWHFLGLTYDGTRACSGIKIYIDNNTAQTLTQITATLNTASTSTTQPMRIGYSQSNATRFAGNVNQFSWYDAYVLTTSDITTLINGGHPGNLASMGHITSWWEMNQLDNASTITDRIGSITGTGVNLTAGSYVSTGPTPP